MPLVKNFSSPSLNYSLWKIGEEFDALEALASLSTFERAELKSISNKKRRLEWIAARVALKKSVENSGETYFGTFKDKFGRPHLLHNYKQSYISISHSGEFAIAAVSKTHTVGVDLQKSLESLNTIKSKFLSDIEQHYYSLSTLKLCVMWSAKEAVYKAFCDKINSMKDDILIHDFKLKAQDTISAAISSDTRPLGTISISYELLQDYVISVITQSYTPNCRKISSR